MSYKYNRIRDLREDADLTQTEIARIIHMHKTTYVRLLAKYYNVSLDYLAGLTNKKN